jgi:hypothetical protein
MPSICEVLLSRCHFNESSTNFDVRYCLDVDISFALVLNRIKFSILYMTSRNTRLLCTSKPLLLNVNYRRILIHTLGKKIFRDYRKRGHHIDHLPRFRMIQQAVLPWQFLEALMYQKFHDTTLTFGQELVDVLDQSSFA